MGSGALGAVLAIAFMLTGVIIYAIHGEDASTKSQDLFDLVNSGGQGYPKYFQDFNTCLAPLDYAPAAWLSSLFRRFADWTCA